MRVASRDGKFLPFLDTFLSSHLKLNEIEAFQHYSAEQGEWITVIRNSPPLSVHAGSVHHFKFSHVVVSPDNLDHLKKQEAVVQLHTPKISKGPGQRQNEIRRKHVKWERSLEEFQMFKTCDIINVDSDSDCKEVDSPCPKWRMLISSSVAVLDCPSQLAVFPSKYAGDICDRLQWIQDHREEGVLRRCL